MDISESCPAQTHSRRNILQAALHQHHICGINGNISSGTNGNTNIRPRQCRRIIDTITCHGYPAFFLQGTDYLFLAIRQYSCDHLRDTGPCSYCPGSSFIITGQHDHTDSHVCQLLHCFRAVLFDHICNSDHTKELVINSKQQRCLSLSRKLLYLFLCVCRKRNFAADIGKASSGQKSISAPSKKTVPGKRLKLCYFFCSKLLFPSVCYDCSCQRMLTVLLERISKCKQAFLWHTFCRQYIGHSGFTLSNGSCLIQYHDFCLAGFFQRSCCLK